MAIGKRISDLSTCATLDGNEYVEIEQSSASKKAPLTSFAVYNLAGTFTASQTIQNGVLYLYNTTPAANNRRWYTQTNTSGSLVIGLISDDSGTTGDFITVTRSGQTVTGISITGPITTPNTSASEVGFKGVPNTGGNKSGNYTLVLTDASTQVLYSGVGAHTITIPANSSVAFPVGTEIDILGVAGGVFTLAITTDTLTFASGGGTGSRTMAAVSRAKILKIGSTEWIVSNLGGVT